MMGETLTVNNDSPPHDKEAISFEIGDRQPGLAGQEFARALLASRRVLGDLPLSVELTPRPAWQNEPARPGVIDRIPDDPAQREEWEPDPPGTRGPGDGGDEDGRDYEVKGDPKGEDSHGSSEVRGLMNGDREYPAIHAQNGDPDEFDGMDAEDDGRRHEVKYPNPNPKPKPEDDDWIFE